MKFEESSFEKLAKLSRHALCKHIKLDMHNRTIKCTKFDKEIASGGVMYKCGKGIANCVYFENTLDEPEPPIQLEDEPERELDFLDTSTYSQTDMHNVYSTMLNPWCGNAPSEYADFFYAARSKNMLLHKLNCIICALKMSNNGYAQNIKYFDSYDMEEATRNLLKNVSIRLD